MLLLDSKCIVVVFMVAMVLLFSLPVDKQVHSTRRPERDHIFVGK